MGMNVMLRLSEDECEKAPEKNAVEGFEALKESKLAEVDTARFEMSLPGVFNCSALIVTVVVTVAAIDTVTCYGSCCV